jgi:hypothetical protein
MRQAKEKDDDERDEQAGLHLLLQERRRLPLQSLQLPKLRLLNETGRVVRDGAARPARVA